MVSRSKRADCNIYICWISYVHFLSLFPHDIIRNLSSSTGHPFFFRFQRIENITIISLWFTFLTLNFSILHKWKPYSFILAILYLQWNSVLRYNMCPNRIYSCTFNNISHWKSIVRRGLASIAPGQDGKLERECSILKLFFTLNSIVVFIFLNRLAFSNYLGLFMIDLKTNNSSNRIMHHQQNRYQMNDNMKI